MVRKGTKQWRFSTPPYACVFEEAPDQFFKTGASGESAERPFVIVPAVFGRITPE